MRSCLVVCCCCLLLFVVVDVVVAVVDVVVVDVVVVDDVVVDVPGPDEKQLKFQRIAEARKEKHAAKVARMFLLLLL